MVNKNDRWSALSMKERADLMNMYITNGISDLKEMKKHYNSFGDGGDTEQESNSKTTSLLKQTIRKAKAGVMDVLQKYQYEPLTEAIKDTWHDIQFGTGSKRDYASNKYEDVAQDSFLFSRKEQKDAFLNSGYIEGTAGDYGLVAKAVGNRNLPVYQSSKDDITRDKLTVIGNLPSMFFGEGELVHAGYYPTALYKDAEGNIYQKAWDLQDYGPDSTGTGGYYSQYPTIKQLGSKILDIVGNPVVRTTGFQQISDDMLYNLMYQIRDSKLWSELMSTKASNAGNTVMEGRVLEAYEDLLFMKAQELADKENREYSMEDYDYIKKTLPLEIFKSSITDYYDSKVLDEIYSIFTNENKFAEGGPTEPLYYDNTPIEPAVVKAFKSQEDYNRYYGEQFGKQIAKKRDKVANNIMHALEYAPFIGDGVDVTNTIVSINEGDYSQAAVLAGLALLPNAIEKPLKGAKKIGRSITHAFSSDYLPTILSDKFGKGVINPSMAVSPTTKTFDNLYGDIVLVGDQTLLDDSFLFRGDGDTSAVGWFTDAYDEVRDVHKVSSQMRAHDVNSPVPQLTKERFLELEAHPEYHEAKRNRITGLNEFKHALVPKEFMQNQEMLEYLNEMGIPYSSYSEGNKVQAINAFLEEHPELLFKCGGKLNIFNTGGPIQTALETDLKGSSYFENVLNSIDQTSDQEALKEATEVDHRLNIRFKVPNDTPEAIYVSKVNNLVKEKSKEEIIKALKTKSEDEIKEIQKQLGDEGYYDFELSTGKSNNASTVQKQLVKEGYLTNKEVDSNVGNITTTALQTMLVDKGYLSRYTQDGKDNIDGILGKRTREAYKQYNRDFNIDGKLGNKTINSFLKSKEKEIKGFDTYVSAEGMVDQCAKWVATKYDTITGVGKQNGVHGNAWNMLTNIEDAGGKMLFNIYDDAVFDNVSTPSQVKQATQQALKNSNIDYSKLIEGDVVGIYIPSSTHYSEVLKSGTTYNTHVGIIVDVENGIPIVEHNILGKVRRERIDKLSGSVYGKPTVTVASRPKTGEQVRQLEFKDVKSKYILPEGKENSLMREYMDSLASAKETFKHVFDNVDLDFIEEAAIAITKRETDFMNNKPSDNRFKPSFIATNIVHQLQNTPQDIISQDLTKMKFNSLNSTYRASIGLSSPEQLSNDPTITGRAVMLLLSKNYDYFTRLAKQNPELGLTKEDIENATILSYNRGIGATHTLGFNKDGSLNVEELKYLRESSKLDAKEKDISSTKLKHVKLLGEKAGQLAEWYYDKYGEPHTPYVSRARQTMLTLQKK